MKIRNHWDKVKDAETPLRVKVIAVLLLIYLANPIDLIPDFIPVLGQLDDIILITLATRWITKQIGEKYDIINPSNDEGTTKC